MNVQLAVNPSNLRQVLDCASPLALFHGRANRKRQRAAALQDAPAILSAALTIASLLLLCPTSARAQGGVPLWTNSYPGSGARAIAVDSSGNVVVTGTGATIKYSNSGVPLWTNCCGALGMAVDRNGNVVVTGGTGSPMIKYSGAGASLWTNASLGRAIAVDQAGNIFVTGYSPATDENVTIKYSSAGSPLWTNLFGGALVNGGPIAVDQIGDVFVTGIFNDLAITTKYSSAGVPLWTNRYSRAVFVAIAVDSNGNVCLTGSSFTDDYLTVKYSSAGALLWTRLYVGSPIQEDHAVAIAVDGSSSVFVTGLSIGFPGNTGYDYATVAYSSGGQPLWTNRYNGPGIYSADGASAIAVDRGGNVFVTGGSLSDRVTVGYSNSGIPVWTNRYVGGGYYGDTYSIAVDSNGNVFVSGYNDCVTIKYSSSLPLPRLGVQRMNNQMVLTWTNAAFTLQTAPAVTGPFTNLPAATSPSTNPLTAPQQFFRLKRN